MDDNELRRIASDNPALTIPAAAQTSPVQRQRSNGANKKSKRGAKEIQETALSADLSKYDVGARSGAFTSAKCFTDYDRSAGEG